MAYANSFYQPDKDAGWGLIFRLNALWEKADRRAVSGDYEGWELVLDAIFRNLLYRNEMEVIVDEDGAILDVKPSEQDIGEWSLMKKKIRQAKLSIGKYTREKNFSMILKSKADYYNAISFYDIWIRKFMQAHQLYLKEVESNPSKALFGGAFKSKRDKAMVA